MIITVILTALVALAALGGGLVIVFRRAYISGHIRGHQTGYEAGHEVGCQEGYRRGVLNSLHMAELELHDNSKLWPDFTTTVHRIIGRIRGQLPEGTK